MKSILKTFGGEHVDKISMNATKIFIGIAMGIHLIVNLIIGLTVNISEDSDKTTKKGSFIGHTIASVIVFLLIIGVMKNPLPIGPQILKQDLFSDGFTIISVPMIAHLVVSIGFIIASFIEEDVTNLKNLSNIFNGVSSLVCSIIIGLCSIPAKKLMSWEKKAKAKGKAIVKKPTEVEEAPGENQVEAAAAGKDPGQAATGLNNASGLKEVQQEEVKAFGKRQRRRNPPKRSKKKY